jgi:hypothetical protein
MQTPPDAPLTSGFEPELLALVEPDVLMVIDVQPPTVVLGTLLRTADGFEPEGEAVQVDGFGSEFDDDLLQLVVSRLGTPLPAADDPDPAVRAIVRRLTTSVRKARLRLADDESIAIATRLGGATAVVTIERGELQDAIRARVEKLRPAVAQAMSSVAEASSGWVVAVLVRGDAVIAPVLAGVLAAESPIRVFAAGIGLLTPARWSGVAESAAAQVARKARRPATRATLPAAVGAPDRPPAAVAAVRAPRFWDRFLQKPPEERRSLVFALWPVAAAVAALFLVSSAGLLGALDAVPAGTQRPDVVRPSATPLAAPTPAPTETTDPAPSPSPVPTTAPAPPAPPATVVHKRAKKKVPPASAGSSGTPATTPSPDPTDTTDPGTGDPGTGDPGTGDPGTGDPGTGDPGTGDPGTGDPGTGDPGTGDPGTGDPGAPVDPGPGGP